jgi:uncharacterized protein (DUF58 family)
VLAWLRRRLEERLPADAAPGEPELFDEAFQKRLEALALLSRRAVIGRHRGERRSKKTGAGIEFADHREYAAGDDFRFIDWNLYGRTDRLLVKLFQEEEDLSVHVLVDVSASMAMGGKLAYAKRLAAALAYVALSGLDRVTVSAFSGGVLQRLEAQRGRGRMLRVLSFLRPLQGSGQTDLAAAMRAFVARGERRGLVLVISDFYDRAGTETALLALRHARFDPVFLHLWAPEEARPSLRPELYGDVSLIDTERRDAREVTITEGVLRRYEDAHALFRARIEKLCAEKHALHAGIETSEAWDDAVLRVLRQGRIAG